MRNDDLWYLRQLELADTDLKERLISEIESEVKEQGACDHVKIFKQIFDEREADKKITFEPTTLESYSDIY